MSCTQRNGNQQKIQEILRQPTVDYPVIPFCIDGDETCFVEVCFGQTKSAKTLVESDLPTMFQMLRDGVVSTYSLGADSGWGYDTAEAPCHSLALLSFP